MSSQTRCHAISNRPSTSARKRERERWLELKPLEAGPGNVTAVLKDETVPFVLKEVAEEVWEGEIEGVDRGQKSEVEMRGWPRFELVEEHCVHGAMKGNVVI